MYVQIAVLPAGTQVHGKEVQLLNYGLIEKLIFIEKVLSYSINLEVFCNNTSGFGLLLNFVPSF